VNRELATLRRLLRLAQEWCEIDRLPRIRLLPGEREFVLSHAQERTSLEAAPQPLADAAMLMLDTVLRVGEVLALECSPRPYRRAQARLRRGKSKNPCRNLQSK